MDTSLIEFEKYCSDLLSTNASLRNKAEEYIVQFRNLDITHPLSWYCIQNSQKEYVTFESAQAIRFGLIRLNSNDISIYKNIMDKILSIIFTLENQNQCLSHSSLNILLNCISICMKRLWLLVNNTQRIDILNLYSFQIIKQIDGDLFNSNNCNNIIFKKFIIFTIFKNIIIEYSISKQSTAFGMKLESHRNCHSSLIEEGHLFKILKFILNELQYYKEFPTYLLSLIGQVLCDILQWNFTASSNWVTHDKTNYSFTDQLDISLNDGILYPPLSWIPVLYNILEGIITIILSCNNLDICLQYFEVLLRLSKLSLLHINDSLKLNYITLFINGLNVILTTFPSTIQTILPFIIQQVLDSFKINYISKLELFPSYLKAFTSYTCNQFTNYSNENLHSIISSWVIIASESSLHSSIKDYIISIYCNFTKERLKLNYSTLIDNYNEDYERENEILESISYLGRLYFTTISAFLYQEIQNRINLLNNSNNIILLFEIGVLVELIGYLLADTAQGESVSIPNVSISSNNENPFYILSDFVFKLFGLYDNIIQNINPLDIGYYFPLTLLKYSSRWMNTYLFCDEKQYNIEENKQFSRFGSSNGLNILESIISWTLNQFSIWNNSNIILNYISNLFKQIASSRIILSKISKIPSYNRIVEILIKDNNISSILTQCSKKNIKSLSQSIIQFTNYSQISGEKASKYIIKLYFNQFLNSTQDIKNFNEQNIDFLIQFLRGISLSINSVNDCIPFLDNLVFVFENSNNSHLLFDTLKFFIKYSSVHIDFMEENQQILLGKHIISLFNRIDILLSSITNTNNDDIIDYLKYSNKLLLILLESFNCLPNIFKNIISHSLDIIFKYTSQSILSFPEISILFYMNLNYLCKHSSYCISLKSFHSIIDFLKKSILLDHLDARMKSFEGLYSIIEFIIVDFNHPSWNIIFNHNPNFISSLFEFYIHIIMNEFIPKNSFQYISKSLFFLIIHSPNEYSNSISILLQNIKLSSQQKEQLSHCFRQLLQNIDIINTKKDLTSLNKQFNSFNSNIIQFFYQSRSLIITK